LASNGPSSDPYTQLPAAIAAAAADDLDAALGGILEVGARAVGSASTAIFLVDPDRPGLQLAASTGLTPDAAASLAVAASDAAHPLAVAVADRTPRYDQPAAGGSSVAAHVPCVIRVGGVETVLGVLAAVWPAPHTTSPAERDVIASLAALAALATDRARNASTAAERSEWFERMAHTDPLTGIANERTVARVLELELARAGRQGGEVSLALFDVDDFRSANDSAGHQAGDDILRHVASVLAESVRLVDTVGRIGGDEFVLIAPGSAGTLVAKRIQDGIAALPQPAGRSVTVSAGVARFPADGADAETLIAAATEALARAKAAGAGTVADAEAVPGSPG
jgi:diguanylate cyclase (GGDEF)-like protein